METRNSESRNSPRGKQRSVTGTAERPTVQLPSLQPWGHHGQKQLKAEGAFSSHRFSWSLREARAEARGWSLDANPEAEAEWSIARPCALQPAQRRSTLPRKGSTHSGAGSPVSINNSENTPPEKCSSALLVKVGYSWFFHCLGACHPVPK